MNNKLDALFNQSKVVFWDFDGVIKDSVAVKSDAFEALFSPFGEEVAKKVRQHHEENGGMSRFDKLPIYLKWSGESASPAQVEQYAIQFSQLVKEKVIHSVWVEGVLDYLTNNYKNQQFFLVTATPQQEIEEILLALNIEQLFQEVVGSPTTKSNAIKAILKKQLILPENSVMIGDSMSDYSAAKLNNVPFILRKTKLNKQMQEKLSYNMIENFL